MTSRIVFALAALLLLPFSVLASAIYAKDAVENSRGGGCFGLCSSCFIPRFVKLEYKVDSAITKILKIMAKKRLISSETALQKTRTILSGLPTLRIPSETVLGILSEIWPEVNNGSDRLIFEEVSHWAVLVFSQSYPEKYFDLLELIIMKDFQYLTFQYAVSKANLLSEEQLSLLIDCLMTAYLELDFEASEYKNYGKFNVHFIELAKNYPVFNPALPFFVTPTLRIIFETVTDFAKILYASPPAIEVLATHLLPVCLDYELPAHLIAEQVEIILQINFATFQKLPDNYANELLSEIVEVLDRLAYYNLLFNERDPLIRVLSLVIQQNLDFLLNLLLSKFHSQIHQNDVEFLFIIADRTDDPLGVLLTLSSFLPMIPEYQDNDKSLRLVVFSEVVSSIKSQNLKYEGPYSNNLGTRPKPIVWILPAILKQQNYDLMAISDILVVPLIFIQKVFQKDLRKASNLIQSSIRGCQKPSFTKFLKLINELLVEQYGFYFTDMVKVLPSLEIP